MRCQHFQKYFNYHKPAYHHLLSQWWNLPNTCHFNKQSINHTTDAQITFWLIKALIQVLKYLSPRSIKNKKLDHNWCLRCILKSQGDKHTEPFRIHLHVWATSNSWFTVIIYLNQSSSKYHIQLRDYCRRSLLLPIISNVLSSIHHLISNSIQCKNKHSTCLFFYKPSTTNHCIAESI